MTLTMAWVRNVGRQEELVFCSDSRLRFGCAWDSCQKVFPLHRGDCAIAFAGDTMFAYPFVHTAMNAVSLHRRSSSRIIDLYEAKSFLLNSINGMMTQIGDVDAERGDIREPDIRLIFGGYSWLKKRFAIWKFSFNPTAKKFHYVEIGKWKGLGKNRRLVILGDPTGSPWAVRRAVRVKDSPLEKGKDVELIAKNAFIKLLETRGIKDSYGLDMEPFEVLTDLIKSNASAYVGGPPQLVKVYQHLNAQAFGIPWTTSRSRIAVLGRCLPHGEKMNVPILDLEIFHKSRRK